MAEALIQTARLSLRPLTDAAADVDVLVDLDSDAEVMRYLTNGQPTSRTDMVGLVTRMIGSRWLAFDASDEFVGWFGLPSSSIGEYELGYRLRKIFWGRGYATEGARAVLAYAFEELAARRVWAQTMAVNTRSRGVLERCGLRYVRTVHVAFDDPIPGTELGEVEYEITREQWPSSALSRLP